MRRLANRRQTDAPLAGFQWIFMAIIFVTFATLVWAGLALAGANQHVGEAFFATSAQLDAVLALAAFVGLANLPTDPRVRLRMKAAWYGDFSLETRFEEAKMGALLAVLLGMPVALAALAGIAPLGTRYSAALCLTSLVLGVLPALIGSANGKRHRAASATMDAAAEVAYLSERESE